MPLSVPGRRPHDLSRCGDRAPAEAPYLLPVCDKARILLCALSCTKYMRSQNGIVHFSSSDGALRGAAPGFRKGRCYVAASNFRCACNAAVRPSQLQPLTMSTMLGRPVVTPLRASSRFWTRNLLMSESGTSTRPPPLLCHLTSPDWSVRGPHRGVAPLLHSAPKPSSTGTSRFTLPLLLLPPPPTLHPVLAISPATPLRDGFRTAFPAGHFFTSHCQSPRGACFPNIPWLHRHQRKTM